MIRHPHSPIAIVFVVLLFSISGPAHSATSFPGAVIVKKGEVLWGQYREIKGIRGVEFPKQSEGKLSEVLKLWPVSGASTVVLRCQSPGERFFSVDGERIATEKVDRLRENIVAVNSFDMLPIVLIFHPMIACQLASPEAYTSAVSTLIEDLGPDCWYLLAISDELDHPDWKIQDPGSDPISVALDIAESVKERYPKQILAAGSRSREDNKRLFAEGSPLDVLFARVESLDAVKGLMDSERIPAIGTALSSDISDDELENAASLVGSRRIGDTCRYGFAVLFDDESARMESVRAVLESLKPMVDAFQKKITGAVPPSSDMNETLDPKEAEEGFVSLFNGKDLSGWVPISEPENFVVREGAIQLDKFGGGWLRSWESYDDFIFRGEYWIAEGGNSGFFARVPLVGRGSRIGFEFQIQGQDKDAPITNDVTGSIYDVKPPEGIFIKPNDWNEVEIQCVGPEVKITWNGEIAHHFKYEEVEPMRHRALSGYIGLQDHHNEVKFRNLRIKRLP